MDCGVIAMLRYLMKVAVGDEAPDFVLPTAAGESLRLSALRGRKVVLFFYPLNDSPGCAAQACGFRDAYEELVRAGAQVVGVNGAEVASHRQFAARRGLPFPLVSDAGNAVRRRYGAVAGLLPTGRVTYLIDEDGVVRDIFSSLFQPLEHVRRARAWAAAVTR